ncbi:MAG: NUDIX domain-containing protein [Actinomycetia bacterium]|nr:NUDIX domain-containing protein [Actinomycetes bacterium]
MIRVVAAMILRDGPGGTAQVLAGRRTSPPELAGQWEFPGGKVENGEDDMTALRREIREELSVELAIHGPLGGELPMVGGPGVWQPYLARITSGEPVAQDHDQLKWLCAEELGSVQWLSSDLPVLVPLSERMRNTLG